MHLYYFGFLDLKKKSKIYTYKAGCNYVELSRDIRNKYLFEVLFFVSLF